MSHASRRATDIHKLCTMQFSGYAKSAKGFHTTQSNFKQLEARLLQFAFANLLIVSLLGVVLRAYPFTSSILFEYKNLLHGHSHFAFGGWVMPVLLALIIKAFPELHEKISFRHWRNISFLLLFSAYGMLVFFPLQGYKAGSIIFSTLSVLAGYYLAFVCWKALKKIENKTIAHSYLKWGLVFLVVSAIGPFATGPLIAMNYQGKPIYYNAIYFYLHFQYNGWFQFAVLAFLYKFFTPAGGWRYSKIVFWLFTIACLPAYALSVLWTQPSIVFNIIGGTAAFMQLLACFFLWKDLRRLDIHNRLTKWMLLLVFSFFLLKNFLQFFSAFQFVADMAYQYRNFVIAYLHLVLLGVISLFAILLVIKQYKLPVTGLMKMGVAIFIFSFITTEFMLVLSAFGGMMQFVIPHFSFWLLAASCFFPAGLALLMGGINKSARVQLQVNKDAVIALERLYPY